MSVSVLVISSECVCGCEYVGDFFIVYVYMWVCGSVCACACAWVGVGAWVIDDGVWVGACVVACVYVWAGACVAMCVYVWICKCMWMLIFVDFV